MSKYGKHTTIILTKMFEVVGKKYSEKKTISHDWFMKNSWTEKQQADFIDWIADYLYNSVEARREIMKFPIKDKKTLS